MYYLGSVNINSPRRRYRGCFSKWVSLTVTNHHCIFLWQEDPTTNVVVYQYTRHIFGAKDSPTCANYALQRTNRDNVNQYPEPTRAVLENFYMDNYLESVESPERALKKPKELVHLLHLGGFKLTKFVSNVPNLADRIDGSPQSTEQKVNASSKEESSHVLGLKWDHIIDTLVVSRGNASTVTKSLTQRLVLSLVSKVFDPIGLVAPVTVDVRLLLMDIWRVSRQHWVEEIPKETVESFLEWSVELPKLAKSLYRGATFRENLNTWNFTCLAIVPKRSSALLHFSEIK